MLRFEKVWENDMWKTSNFAFQMLYFKRCGLKKYGKMKYFYNVIHSENK